MNQPARLGKLGRVKPRLGYVNVVYLFYVRLGKPRLAYKTSFLGRPRLSCVFWWLA